VTPRKRAYLDAACGADAKLRQRVEALLRAAENAGDFLETPPTGLGNVAEATLELGNLSEQPGDKIGRYKLLQQIGEGGCGVVYMAEQEEPVRRRVALKVIKLGMNTKSVIARFEAERQALALMDHPNIAKVFDAGATENGRPYFVMELVRGIKITEYCDQNNLSTEERLKLFTQVCHAIQHAHQKGIIHRDIKPSNILVTQNEKEAVPKVIDFGIAKATTDQRLTDKTVFTAFEQFIGTPAYMSPEQAMMTSLDIDTRTDIYALGVLLYELLTGTTPFDANDLMAAGLDAMRRTIREQEPVRPSTKLTQALVAPEVTRRTGESAGEPASSRRRLQEVAHQLKGDLDWIVMKALEKDRTRRYETANGLAMDIQRHLSNEPVTARPPSRLYEFQKTVRRHKFGFAAAAALIFVLAIGVLASSWQALRAKRAEREQFKLREEAETEATKSQQVAQFMQDMLKGVGPSVAMGRDTAMLREILDRTVERIAQDLKNQPEVEAELRNSIGAVYWELGEFDKAAAMHLQALTTQRKLVGQEHPSVATSLHYLARALREQGKRAESEATYRESLAMRKKLLGNENAEVARTMNDLASLLSDELKDGEPEALLREALRIRRKLFENDNPDVARSLDDLAYVLNRHGQVNEAVAMHYEALAIRKRTLGENHVEVIYSYRNLARALEAQGQPTEAEKMLRHALAVSQTLLGNQHPDQPGIIRDLANLIEAQGRVSEAAGLRNRPGASSQTTVHSLHEAGKHLQQQGRLAEAETNFREALALRRKQFGDVHREVVDTLAALGLVLHQEKKLAEAEQVNREALATERKLSGDEHLLVASAMRQLAGVLNQPGRWAEAETLIREAWVRQRKLLGDAHLETAASLNLLWDLLDAQGKVMELEILLREQPGAGSSASESAQVRFGHLLWKLGEAYATREQFAEAERNYGQALQQFKQLQVQFPTNAFYRQEEAASRRLLAIAKQGAGRLSEAEADLRAASDIYARLVKEVPASTFYPQELAYTRRRLLETWMAQGKFAEAEAFWREELFELKQRFGEVHREVIEVLGSLGRVLRDAGKLAEAEAVSREALVLHRRLPNCEPTDVARALDLMWELLVAQDKVAGMASALKEQPGAEISASERAQQVFAHRLWQLGDAYFKREQLKDAERTYQQALQQFSKLEAQFPTNAFYRQEQAFSYRKLSQVMQRTGRFVEIEASLRRAADIYTQLAHEIPASTFYPKEAAITRLWLAEVLGNQGQHAEARTIIHEEAGRATDQTFNGLAWVLATSHHRELRDGPSALKFAEQAVSHTNRKDPLMVDTLAAAYAEVGQFTNAVRVQQEAIALIQDEAQRKECASRLKLYEANLPYRHDGRLAHRVSTLMDEQKYESAEPLTRELLAQREILMPDDWRMFNARSLLGGCLLGQQKYAEAEPLLLSSYAGMKERKDQIPAGNPNPKRVLTRLVQLYEATGQPDKVTDWKQKLAALEQNESAKSIVPPEP